MSAGASYLTEDRKADWQELHPCCQGCGSEEKTRVIHAGDGELVTVCKAHHDLIERVCRLNRLPRAVAVRRVLKQVAPPSFTEWKRIELPPAGRKIPEGARG